MSSVSYVTGNKTKVYKCNKKIKCICREETKELPEKELLHIGRFWQEMVKKNTSLFNGKVLTAEHIVNKDNEITIQMMCTDYAHLTFTMNFLNENITVCKSIASGGLLVTSDNYLVFGKMGKTTSFPGVIQCIGGGIDMGDFDANADTEPTANTVIRECEEEIGIRISKEDIKCTEKYLYLREKMSTIGFCYVVQLNINHYELSKFFESYKISHDEIEELVFIKNSPNDIVAFCQNNMLVDYIKGVVLDYSGINSLEEY